MNSVMLVQALSYTSSSCFRLRYNRFTKMLPNLIGPHDFHPMQPVGIALMLRVQFAGSRSRSGANSAGSIFLRQRLYALAVDRTDELAQEHYHAPASIERQAGIFLVNQRAQLQIILILDRRCIVTRVTAASSHWRVNANSACCSRGLSRHAPIAMLIEP
jgi:hypothetical protein